MSQEKRPAYAGRSVVLPAIAVLGSIAIRWATVGRNADFHTSGADHPAFAFGIAGIGAPPPGPCGLGAQGLVPV